MFFRQLLAKDATLSYFFGCGSCHVGVAVDPVLGDEQWFIDEAAKQDVKITHVIDTHVHADHFSGGRKLAELAGATYCLHEANAGRVNYPFDALKDGQRIEIGNVFVDVLHTPGHTPDSICLVVTDKRRTETPWFCSPAIPCSSAAPVAPTSPAAKPKWRGSSTTPCTSAC